MAVTQLTLEASERGTFVKPKRKGGDHKRKARAIAPATVHVRDGEIVVVVPDVLGKNEAHRQGRFGARVISAATKRYRESVTAAIVAHVAKQCAAYAVGRTSIMNYPASGVPLDAMATAGAWRLEVIGVWPNENHQVGFAAPRGDADAAIPQALDALQHAGILDDDARVVEVRAWNLYRKGERWTVIRLVRVPDLAERDAAIAHLVAALPPPTPAPVVTAKPRTKTIRRKSKETTA